MWPAARNHDALMRKLARNVRQARWRDWSFWGLALICHMLITRTYGVKRIPSYAGPFVAFVERLDNCPPPPVAASNISVRLTHFKPSRPMDKQYAWGSFTWPLDMDDESYLNMHLDKWANNQWKQNFFVFNFKNKACTVMRDYMPAAKFIFDVAKSAGATSEKGKCIMPEGTYTLANTTLDIMFPSVPVMPYGRYRATMVIGSPKKPDILNCLDIFAQIVPKPV